MKITLCGKLTKKKKPCAIPLRGGKCVTHDADLSARNKRVAQAFATNHPAAFTAQRRRAGHFGFVATGGKHGWEAMNEKARQYRLNHPSQPERDLIEAFSEQSINHYERELVVTPDGTTIDFGWSAARRGIEVEGHRAGGFGDPETRRAKQDRKVARLEAEGWLILRYDPTIDPLERALEFARVASAKEETAHEQEIPF